MAEVIGLDIRNDIRGMDEIFGKPRSPLEIGLAILVVSVAPFMVRSWERYRVGQK